MGLLEEDSRQRSLNKMTQDLTRFLLQTMADDYRTKSPTPAAMEQVSRASPGIKLHTEADCSRYCQPLL